MFPKPTVARSFHHCVFSFVALPPGVPDCNRFQARSFFFVSGQSWGAPLSGCCYASLASVRPCRYPSVIFSSPCAAYGKCVSHWRLFSNSPSCFLHVPPFPFSPGHITFYFHSSAFFLSITSGVFNVPPLGVSTTESNIFVSSATAFTLLIFISRLRG